MVRDVLKGVALVCSLTLATAITRRCYETVRKKSVAQAQDECVQYLGIPRARLAVYNEHIYPKDVETQHMVRCMGINLGWWNDTSGVQQAAMRNFFHPDPDDCQYDRRTYHCLKSQRLDNPALHVDASERAYESFRCYFEQYGNIVSTPQFVPLSPLELGDVFLQCSTIMQRFDGGTGLCDASGMASRLNDKCILRCVLLRSGLYSSQHGPNYERLYVQCNNYAINETQFRKTTDACYQRLKRHHLDECSLIHNFFVECFDEGGFSLALELHVIISSILSILPKFFPLS